MTEKLGELSFSDIREMRELAVGNGLDKMRESIASILATPAGERSFLPSYGAELPTSKDDLKEAINKFVGEMLEARHISTHDITFPKAVDIRLETARWRSKVYAVLEDGSLHLLRKFRLRSAARRYYENFDRARLADSLFVSFKYIPPPLTYIKLDVIISKDTLNEARPSSDPGQAPQ